MSGHGILLIHLVNKFNSKWNGVQDLSTMIALATCCTGLYISLVVLQSPGSCFDFSTVEISDVKKGVWGHLVEGSHNLMLYWLY